ncbi:MAG: aminotransferase class IV [Spirochaeta sp.]|jgi:branched-chain amino acid aminotransferase|nr:aminotransferase class IV [Spirochaeta sp.]
MNTIIELRSAEIFRVPTPATTLRQAAAEEPSNGVYLVARTYRTGSVLRLDDHFDRMERSAARLGVPDLSVPRRRIREILAGERPADGDIRFRVTAVLDTPVWYRITTEPAAEPPPELRRDGVDCDLAVGAARENPTVKSTAWMHTRTGLGSATVYEHLLTDDAGAILEGATSNFYAVVAGTLRTAGEGVLEGISRKIVLEVAAEVLPVVTTPITRTDLAEGTVSEACISSATRGIVPVRRIGEFVIGPPGPVTRELIAGWERWMDAHLEPISLP